MKSEKSKPVSSRDKTTKEIESEENLTEVEGETFVDKERQIDKEVLELLASRSAFIEFGIDKTGAESATVKRKKDNKILMYTIFPWEIEELKKVSELANSN